MTKANLDLVEVYTQGIKAWFADEENGWVSASVISKQQDDKSVKISFLDDIDAEKQHVFEASLADIESGKISLPPLRNPPKMENTDDLTNLSYLNEPSVLQTIKTRYEQNNIYTYSGIVLIAANPFARVKLYDPEIIQKYSGSRRGELEPHLFAIAEDAYRCMIRDNKNQTIIVSGESGAGKTVSAKYIMRYFATADDKEASGKQAKGESMTEVEEQILATNPIMEAFGNAKTTRNDNSSRFGKYIQIEFDKQRNIVGAKIKTYLLERSRLIFQPATERNYHVFYQLCSGATDAERQELDLKPWSEFHYMNQSGTGSIDGVDDAKDFAETREGLKTIGINENTQTEIFRLLAALLHLGNIEIGGRNDATLPEDEPSLVKATELLGLDTSEFRKWIVRRQIVTRSEKIISNLNPTQAQVVRDSVAKFIYANLFDWLVNVINDSLSCSDVDQVASFIGVLDIYGFEHFKKNSFEQFCINYANEKLQQQFNQHVFKLEQEEYVKEQIDWKFISFSDNQKCIEMIEAKMGILSLLDEESRLPSGSDQGFCNKLYQNFGNAPQFQDYFKKPRFSNNAFVVAHYAHDVQYEAEGFMDKNKDTVPDELLNLLQASKSQFLSEMIQPAPSSPTAEQAPAKKTLSTAKKPTLGSIFKLSLITLMDTIGETNVHYIRCIKPNEAKVAWVFQPSIVLSQLRACGVLETIRISCAGYPTRWTFEDFAERYHALIDFKQCDPKSNADIRGICSQILDTAIHDTNKYQVGLTKIFFRAGQLAYMEKLRSDRLNSCAIMIQKNIRRYLARLHYLRTRKAILMLQSVARQKHAVQKLEHMRQEKAAIVIQKNWRRYIARKKYLQTRQTIIQIQSAVRGTIARKKHATLKRDHAAVLIQKVARGWLARKRYQAIRQYVIQVQTCVRRRQARRQLVLLRAEARSVSHLKEASYKLESRVVDLIQNLTQQREEKSRLKLKAVELENQVRSWIEKYDRLDQKAKEIADNVGNTETTKDNDTWAALKSQRDALQAEYASSLNKIKSQDKELMRLKEELLSQRNDVAKLRVGSKGGFKRGDTDISELKNQISALKAQTEYKLYVQ
ncbi:P-loop containing nucleoside triphosphate hydrolase protein [Gilbertella persicaria]|uniref:P-loop containing nucleoside triphosphate hydrolase protein n=1 Tax=Gilbertella persicaria TaxID=101096 RepID=UPI0022208FB7|nr:P-loop containing nucleoside triphosphate hydrolase protein [Gilbertella persicaria]KAI8059029.1 P-loop containing nucleoside triphosphate hydrolase protein [Gilbertella persicaria]